MFASKHSPTGTNGHFDNAAITELIGRYQALGDPEALAGIITRAQERAKTLIRFNGTVRYCSEAELLSDVNWKLLRAVGKFDPEKGSAFTFLSQVISSTLCTSVSIARRTASRYLELDENFASTLPASTESELGPRAAADDLAHRIKAGVKTTLTDETELAAQRWFIDSFTEDGFEARRHQCANAAIAVYGLSHARSRELYDLTMLEVRRLLYDEVKGRKLILPGRLIGTRCAWMTRYEPLLNAQEFTKFVVLMRDLAPYLLLLIDPANHNRRQDRNPPIERRNLELILYGCPEAVRLFSDHGRAPEMPPFTVLGEYPT